MNRGWVRKIVWVLVLMLAFAGAVIAQEPTPSNTASVDQEKQDQEAKEKAKKDAEEQTERNKPVRDRMFSDVRNSAALSLGILENFDSNLFYNPQNAPGDAFTLIYPRFVANVQREHGTFSVEYRGGYRVYSRFSELQGGTYRDAPVPV